MSFSIKGTIEAIFDVEQVTEKFSKRDFVVKIEEKNQQYPNFVKFQLVQDRTDLVSNMQYGQEVEVSFDLRGRETNGKYWTNIQAWRVQAIGDAKRAQPDVQSNHTEDQISKANTNSSNDLPF